MHKIMRWCVPATLPTLYALLSSMAYAAYDSAAKPTSAEVHVLRITPEGTQVPPGRQVVVTFDRPMAPLGDMASDAAKTAVTISPAPACHWRWLDPRSLVCELDANDSLKPATEYQVVVNAGLKAEDGATLPKAHRTTFTTERPIVKAYSFAEWQSPGTPTVRLVFNQPVTQDSVEASLAYSGQTKTQAKPDPYLSEVFYVLPLPGEKQALALPNGSGATKSDDRLTTATNANGEKIAARRVWLVSPSQELAENIHVELQVSPGLRGSTGALLGTEKRTIVEFDTFPAFRFIGIRCRASKARTLIKLDSPLAQQESCDPMSVVSLVFSAPVIASEIKDHLILTPDLTAGRTDFDPWANVWPTSQLRQPHTQGKLYEVVLPQHLRAFHEYGIAGLAQVRDEFGRLLDGTGAMQFRTGHRPPRLRLSHSVAVLEKNASTQVPLYVTNLTDIDIGYSRLTSQGVASDLQANQKIDAATDIAYATPLMIRKLLGGQSGIIAGTLRPKPTPPAADRGTYFNDDISDDDPAPASKQGERNFFAEVTPYQVHVKLGHYNTLVWVTSLGKGIPIANARVQIFEGTYRNLSAAQKILGQAITNNQGIAMLPGRETLDPQLEKHGFGALESNSPQLIVRVDADDDIAVLPLDREFAIDTYRASQGRIWPTPARHNGHIKAWGTTAQGVYKLGDKVEFKLYVRNQNNSTLEPVRLRKGYKLQVFDPTNKVIYENVDGELSPFGALAGSFVVPSTAAVGWYEFKVTLPTEAAANAGEKTIPQPAEMRTAMRVLVADFTPAPFQVHTTLNGAYFQPGDLVDVATQATLHAGGPYANAQSRITARVWPRGIDVTTQAAAGFNFSSVESNGYCSSMRQRDVVPVHSSENKVNDRGELGTKFSLTDAGIVYGRMEVESAVRDERGKYVASRAHAEYRGRDRYVGLRSDRWTFEEGKPAELKYLVVDEQGKIVSHVPVSISIHGRVTTAARVKGAGNAYLTSYNNEWEDRGGCSGHSADIGQTCSFTPTTPGLYSLQATIEDTKGRTHSTELCAWVTGKGAVLWEEPADMSVSVLPEKESYQVGETARYLVRNPFPGASALITIERFGVLKSWVQTLAGNTPIIEFPVERDYLPGYYLSVIIMSPRVAPPPRQASDAEGVDLGRPTYRIGYVRATVTDPYKALEVAIHSAKNSYKPGDTVQLELDAAPREKNSTAEPIEYAVAVLDEAIFDLIQDGKDYFDPYRGFYKLDPLDLANFGLLNRLVGLQKFEKKGANSGGDGGAGFDMRVISKYVAYWNPAIDADGSGKATVQFKLPANLTGWRVFAIAVTPSDRLGLGDYKFKSSKLTELRPVMPNQLTQNDRFTAGFSVLNRADKARTIKVQIKANGAIAGGSATTEKLLQLAPFKRETVWLPLEASGVGAINFTASAADALDRDALEHTVPARAQISLDVAASYGTTTSSTVSENIAFPATMRPNVGKLSLTLSPTVIGNLDGALRNVRDYLYDCWEQRLTRALMAADYLRLRPYLPKTFEWIDAETLPQTVLDEAASYQAPNGGMGFWKPQNDRVSPYLSAATALAFNRLRDLGYRVPANVEQQLDRYLDRFLREKVAPTFYSEGMVSSVRAVALQALAERQVVKLADVARYSEFAARMDLFGLAAYLQAALNVKGGEALAASTAQRILSHANESAGKFQFTEMWDDGYAQLLATPLRSQCAILQALVAYGETEAGAKQVGDIPFKLVRFITQARGQRDHWENTQENLYCLNALTAYSRVYEEQAPAFTASVSLDDMALGSAKFSSLRDPSTHVERPNGASDAGRHAELQISKEGKGRLYYTTRISFANSSASSAITNAGIEVHREYSVQRDGQWHLLRAPLQIKRGEIVRVDLYLSLPAARNFVVVDDPVPGGLEPVNRDLATASTVDADAAEFVAAGGAFWFKYGDWSEYGVSLWNFYHRELRHDSARFYADYLGAGHYHLSYAAQAITEGQFLAAPVKAEEMYEPDVYGRGLTERLIVDHD